MTCLSFPSWMYATDICKEPGSSYWFSTREMIPIFSLDIMKISKKDSSISCRRRSASLLPNNGWFTRQSLHDTLASKVASNIDVVSLRLGGMKICCTKVEFCISRKNRSMHPSSPYPLVTSLYESTTRLSTSRVSLSVNARGKPSRNSMNVPSRNSGSTRPQVDMIYVPLRTGIGGLHKQPCQLLQRWQLQPW
jgi:hypothetical protein